VGGVGDGERGRVGDGGELGKSCFFSEYRSVKSVKSVKSVTESVAELFSQAASERESIALLDLS